MPAAHTHTTHHTHGRHTTCSSLPFTSRQQGPTAAPKLAKRRIADVLPPPLVLPPPPAWSAGGEMEAGGRPGLLVPLVATRAPSRPVGRRIACLPPHGHWQSPCRFPPPLSLSSCLSCCCTCTCPSTSNKSPSTGQGLRSGQGDSCVGRLGRACAMSWVVPSPVFFSRPRPRRLVLRT